MGEPKRVGELLGNPGETKQDSAMVAAVKEGAIQHKRLLDGEITQSEYEALREEILVKHGI